MSAPTPTAPPAEHYEGTVPLPQPLKQKIKDGLVALSLANLCFVGSWFSVLYDADFSFFNSLPATRPTLLALAANIFWLALVVWLVMRALHRFQNKTFHFIAHCFFFLLLLIPLEFVRASGWFPKYHDLFQLLKQPAVICAAAIIFAFVAWQHRRIAKVTAVMVAILSPMAFVTLGKIILLCLGVIHLKEAVSGPASPALVPVGEGRPRVVWIIFDEMDFRVAFEQRPANLPLPEFDRLRNGSLFATSAYPPPGDATKIAMPSLISGRRITSISIANSSDMTLVPADTGWVTNWSELPSVFASARKLGVNTALVGWYLPYSRVLGGDLNYCAWHPNPAFQPARARTFGAAMLREIATCSSQPHIRSDTVRLYLDTMTESLSLVTNATYGLILLHLFPPHAPYLYLPDKKQFTIWAVPGAQGYFNNLQLADRSLGELRRAMETSGEWDKTWLIVSADHSWRTSYVYDGQRDYRVPYLVKPPGAGEPMNYSRQFNTVLTHDLILAILRGEVANQQNTADWLDARGMQAPPVTGGNQTH